MVAEQSTEKYEQVNKMISQSSEVLLRMRLSVKNNNLILFKMPVLRL